MHHPEEYVEAVLTCVESVPPGRVTTYGAIAEAVGVFGPRRVGNVLAEHGGGVPWWRVVRADGSLPPSHAEQARAAYVAEGTARRPSGAVDIRVAFYAPAMDVADPGGPTRAD